MTATRKRITTPQSKQEMSFAQKFANSSRFEIAQLIKNLILSSGKEKKVINPVLLRLRDQALDHRKKWSAKKIRLLFKKISIIISPTRVNENGARHNPIGPNSRLVKHLIHNSTFNKEAFRTALHDILNLISVASTLDPEQQNDLFQNHYPPQDLHCLAGTGSRSEEILRPLTVPKAEAEIMGAYQAAMSESITVASPYVHKGNEVHLPRYLEYLFGITTENEAKKIDNYAMTCSTIPTTISVRATNVFFQSFIKRMHSLLGTGRGEEDIEDAVKLAVKEANKNKDIAEEELESFDLKDITFDPPNRKLLALHDLFKRLNKKRDHDQQLTIYDFTTYHSEDDEIFDIDHERLAKAIAAPYTKRIEVSLKKLGFKTNPVGNMQLLPAKELYSDAIKDVVRNNLLTDNPARISHAVDILYSMSNRSYGAPYYHFFEILSENDFQLHHRLQNIFRLGKIPKTIANKISCGSDTSSKSGILERHSQIGEIKLKDTHPDDPSTGLKIALLSSSQKCHQILQFLVRSNLLHQAMNPERIGMDIFSSQLDITQGLYFRGDFPEILELLKVSKKSISHQLMEDLLSLTSQEGNVEILHNLLTSFHGAEVAANTSLLTACLNDNYEAANLLILAGANANSQDVENKTAIMYAAQKNNTKLVKLLLEYGANPNTLSTEGDSALYYAAKLGNSAIVEEIMKKGANPYVMTTESNKNPLVVASKKGFSDIVETFTKRLSIDLSFQNCKIGHASLEQACLNNHQKTVQVLVDAKANINVKTVGVTGYSNLEFVAAKGYNALAVTLMESGAMVTAKAKKRANAELKSNIKEVKKYVAQIKRIINGRKPKIFAKKKVELDKFLMDLSPEIKKSVLNYQNQEGENLLLFCVNRGKTESLRLLLEHGANSEINVKFDQDLKTTASYQKGVHVPDNINVRLIDTSRALNKRQRQGGQPLPPRVSSSDLTRQVTAPLFVGEDWRDRRVDERLALRPVRGPGLNRAQEELAPPMPQPPNPQNPIRRGPPPAMRRRNNRIAPLQLQANQQPQQVADPR